MYIMQPYTLNNGSNMDKPKFWVKKKMQFINLTQAVFVQI